MTARVFFDREEDANKVAKNLEVEKDCDFSVSGDLEELEVALKQENVSQTTYSVAEVQNPVDRSFL